VFDFFWESQTLKDNYNDTFLNFAHVQASFPACGAVVLAVGAVDRAPFTLEFVPKSGVIASHVCARACAKHLPRQRNLTIFLQTHVGGAEFARVVVHNTPVLSRGPYPFTVPRANQVQFTPTQVCLALA
jgi:hypothetical protein